jgi:hypothetical protein
VRERFFTPRLRVASYEELNAWLLDRCVAYAKAHKHPELADRTIWQACEAERPQLVQITGSFDGFHATQASVSKTCLVRFERLAADVQSLALPAPKALRSPDGLDLVHLVRFGDRRKAENLPGLLREDVADGIVFLQPLHDHDDGTTALVVLPAVKSNVRMPDEERNDDR